MSLPPILRSRAVLVGLVVGVPLSVVLLWLAFRNANPVEVWAALRHANPVYVALAVVAIGGVYVLQAIRWRAIVRMPEDARPTVLQGARSWASYAAAFRAAGLRRRP